jgi:hypothetical protein
MRRNEPLGEHKFCSERIRFDFLQIVARTFASTHESDFLVQAQSFVLKDMMSELMRSGEPLNVHVSSGCDQHARQCPRWNIGTEKAVERPEHDEQTQALNRLYDVNWPITVRERVT